MTDHEPQQLLIDVPPHNGIADTDQRFTTRETIAWCKRVAGVSDYDLDAAACEESHHAATFYTREQNGLIRPWFGDTFDNCPWSDIYPWVLKSWREWNAAADRAREAEGLPTLISISMLLPGDRQHMEWWQDLVEPFRDGREHGHAREGAYGVRLTTHYPPKPRPHYGHPGNPLGIGCVEPNFTSVLLVWRRT